MSVSRINVESLKATGISSNRTIIDTRNTNRIHTFVALLNDREPVENKINLLIESGRQDLYYGSRCKDISAIVDRITSMLAMHAASQFSSIELAEMWINAQIEQLNGRELATLANKAIEECASADHWYTFEKQW
jgi:hypothetical protein